MANGLQFNYLLPHRPEDLEHPTHVQNYLESRSFKRNNGNVSNLMINKPKKRNVLEIENDVTAGQLYKTITEGIVR